MGDLDYKREYERWLCIADDEEIRKELKNMDDHSMEDAFYRDLSFGTGGLRGILGAGINRMNRYVVAKASQGLAEYLPNESSVVIGYDSRINSELFARTAAEVFAANGIDVWIWPELTPVPTVSYAVRKLGASAGVMITASHNPAQYNGYKVYGSDGCQITVETADAIQAEIEKLDIFADVRSTDYETAVSHRKIRYIEASVFDAYIEEVRNQSVLFGDKADREITIVYTPLHGSGLKPVSRILEESGFTHVVTVEEQKSPDGNFPTCPYPNPEMPEAMELGLIYCERYHADILLATDPDADRCGIAVKDRNGYRLLSGNEVGLLLLDYICSQRARHQKMPSDPTFIKTIVTIDLAGKIAEHYGVKTISVLTGFKFIGEVIGKLKRTEDFICGFEESYGYLTGAYVRDKDAVNAALMICEMTAYYRAEGTELTDKLEEIYKSYGYCLTTLLSFDFPGAAGMEQMRGKMDALRGGIERIAGRKVESVIDYRKGVASLPKADVIEFCMEDASVIIRPSGTEPKLKVYVSVTAKDRKAAAAMEKQIVRDIDAVFC